MNFRSNSRITNILKISSIFVLAFFIIYFNSSLSSALIKKTPEFMPGEILVKYKEGTAPVLESEKFIGIDRSQMTPDSKKALKEHNIKDIKVKRVFKERNRDEVLNKFKKRTKRISGQEKAVSLKNIYKLELSKDADILAIIEDLKKDPNIEYAAPNIICKADLVPNDTYYGTTGSWGNTYRDMYGLQRIQAEQAWDISTGYDEVVVAVVDSGVDRNHPDLAGNMWTNQWEIPNNGIDDDGNGFVDDINGWDFSGYDRNTSPEDNDPIDDNGHGTHCSGTIAALTNNGSGVAGVNWRSKIMPVKALDHLGYGSLDDLASAIEYAADNGAEVISNSWGGDSGSWNYVIEDAVNYAHSLGCVVVASAGNDNEDTAGFIPAKFANVITVAATNWNDAKASFSNWGNKMDVAAPGVNILSLRANGTSMGTLVGTNYCVLSGTSMACPHVSGLASLILSVNMDLTNEDVRTIIRSSADDIGDAGFDINFGYGRINAYRALQNLTDLINPDITLIPVTQAYKNQAINITAEATDNCHIASAYLFYKGIGQTTFTQVTMTNISGTDIYSASIPAQITTGQAQYYVKAIDNFNNISQTTTRSITIIADTTAPTITHTPVTKADTFQSISITANITDNISVDKAYLYYTGVGQTSSTEVAMTFNGSNSYSATIPSQAIAGIVKYRIKAIDTSGNASYTLIYNITIEADTTPPQISHVPVTGVNTFQSILISATVNDNKGVSAVYLYYTGVGQVTSTEVLMNYIDGNSYQAIIPSQESGGTVAYQIKAVDASNNIGLTPIYLISITPDIVPPVIIHSPVSKIDVCNPITISAEVTDDRNVGSVNLYLKGIGEALFILYPTTKNGNIYSCAIPVQNIPGVLNYYFVAKDGSNNISTTETYSLEVIDLIPPVITTSQINPVDAGTSIEVTAQITDNVQVLAADLFYKNVNDQDFRIGTMVASGNTFSYTINAQKDIGIVRYYVYAKDTSLNITTTETRSVSITDNSSPVILHNPLTWANEKSPIPINATLTDNGHISQATLYYRNKTSDPWTTKSMELISGESYQAEIPAQNAPTTLMYKIDAKDTASHTTTTSTYSVTIKDITPPVINHSSPGDTPVYKPISISATITDNVAVSDVQMSYRPVGSSSFTSLSVTKLNQTYSAKIPTQEALGVLEYKITATDSSGNKYEPTFSINIIDNLQPSISHSIITKGQIGIPIDTQATVTDNYQVASVILYYTDINGISSSESMSETAPKSYFAKIPAQNGVGNVSYKIEAKDSSSNTTTTSTYNISITDSTKPTIIHTPVGSAEVNSLISINAVITDNASLASVKLYYKAAGSSSFSELLMTKNADVYTAQIPAQTSLGSVSYYIYAKDASNNAQTTSTYITQIIDTTKPAITHSKPFDTANVGETILVSCQASDNYQIKNVKINYKEVTDTQFKTEAMTKSQNNYSFTIKAQNNIGNIKYYIYAEDYSTNSITTETFSINIVDDKAPEIQHTAITTASVNNNIDLTFNIADNGTLSNVILYHKNIGGTYFLPTVLSSNTNTFIGTIEAQISLGSIQYYLTASDASGNTSQSGPFDVLINDTASPEIIVVSHADGEKSFISGITLAGTASDNFGIEKIEVSINNGSFILATGKDNWSTSLSLVLGDNSIKIKATDKANNISILSIHILYELKPQIENISTHKIEKDDGRSIIIYGANFNNVSQIKAGSYLISDYEINTEQTEINIILPPDLPSGTYEIKVTNSFGTSDGGVNCILEIAPFLSAPNGTIYNYPNPFDPLKGSTTITFNNPEDNLSIDVYLFDMNARQIWKRSFSYTNSGQKEEAWDGRTNSGDIVADGIYLVRVVNSGSKKSIAKGKIWVIKK